MRSVELGKVGKKIRQLRKQRGMKLQDVADKSDITAGLLSRIENFRTLPSLPVLHKISIALAVPMSKLVESVGPPKESNYILVRAGEGELDEREDSEGLTYESLLSSDISATNLQLSIVRIPPDTYRPPVANDSMEVIYVLQGDIEYALDEEKVLIRTGDTLFFDGNVPHSLKNIGTENGILLKAYLMKGI